MTNTENSYLIMLDAKLGERGKETIYLCIRDLVEHGLDLARFSAGETRPQRQDITQYLAAWSRHAGLSEEESRGWLVEYCASTLLPLSKRTPAAIRHSTKSNLKYIYGSNVPFLCQCDNNSFHAHCSLGCPVYTEMQVKLLAKAEEALHPKPIVPPAPFVPEYFIPVKKANLEQFQSGMRLAREELQKGTKVRFILQHLHERGFKTRTGRAWTDGTLRIELSKPQISPVPEQGQAGAADKA